MIDTSNLDGDKVKQLIQELFPDKLITSNLKYDVSLEAPKPPQAEKPKEKPLEKASEKSSETASEKPKEPTPVEAYGPPRLVRQPPNRPLTR